MDPCGPAEFAGKELHARNLREAAATAFPAAGTALVGWPGARGAYGGYRTHLASRRGEAPCSRISGTLGGRDGWGLQPWRWSVAAALDDRRRRVHRHRSCPADRWRNSDGHRGRVTARAGEDRASPPFATATPSEVVYVLH